MHSTHSDTTLWPQFKRDIFLLTLCQGLLYINNVAFITINGLIGFALAPLAWMATLPITGHVVGGALTAHWVGKMMRQLGRQKAFQLGICAGIVSMLVCALAVYLESFWLLLGGTLLNGFYNANGVLYRFAATEVAPSHYREKAIAFVLAGGLIGGAVGPNLAQISKDILPVAFVGTYLALTIVAFCALAIISAIRFRALVSSQALEPPRSLSTIIRQPVFIVATLSAAVGFGVMSLLMSATPLAMQHNHFQFSRIAWVIEWHVVGMFAPSFVTGPLIKRFNAEKVIAAGIGLNLVCIAIALQSAELMNFFIALFLLGVGWNFMYIGGSSLLLQACRDHEKTQTQAAMDFCVFTLTALASFAAGVTVTQQGWYFLQWVALPFILLAALGLIYLYQSKKA